ncbi:alkane 1-monooxygenase [Frigidibacter oleivorans]|uniref:alkane 1-monooxygenase n=1 Tax=Frigidibacter oleivorans TaxID=2487129 RepID=UPI000F8E56F7|nr:alkane 1-monooxygenase [Frigidibacter oleivorans]
MTDTAPPRRIRAFALATLVPAALLTAGAVAGGLWLLAALASMTLAVSLLDRLLPEGGAAEAEPPAALALSTGLGIAHLVWVLPLAVAGVAGATGLSGWERFLAFAGFGLWLGQVSNSNAHELIHRPGRWPRRLGVAVYVTLLFGHHASAHRLVHHRHVATPADPNSARLGEGFWRFALRAWAGSFLEGWRAERALRGGAGGAGPYPVYLGGAALALAVSALAFGWAGLAAHLALAGHAQLQLLLSDYVQHYGLTRRLRPDGRAEPVGPGHSWDAPQPFSALMLLNAPRHADHHLHPGRGYPELRLDPAQTPMLPRALPVMAALALVPPLWRRAMDGRVRRWQAAAAARVTQP